MKRLGALVLVLAAGPCAAQQFYAPDTSLGLLASRSDVGLRRSEVRGADHRSAPTSRERGVIT